MSWLFIYLIIVNNIYKSEKYVWFIVYSISMNHSYKGHRPLHALSSIDPLRIFGSMLCRGPFIPYKTYEVPLILPNIRKTQEGYFLIWPTPLNYTLKALDFCLCPKAVSILIWEYFIVLQGYKGWRIFKFYKQYIMEALYYLLIQFANWVVLFWPHFSLLLPY